jgi:hypothetical protein
MGILEDVRNCEIEMCDSNVIAHEKRLACQLFRGYVTLGGVMTGQRDRLINRPYESVKQYSPDRLTIKGLTNEQ